MAKKAFTNWSGGKDSALALYRVLQNPDYSVGKLFTTVSAENGRISMHGVRRELLEAQAERLDIPLKVLELPSICSMETYDELMHQAMQELKSEGFSHAIFGDIFLEDLKAYRDKKLKAAGFSGIYPIWKENTKDLMDEFLQLGFKTRTSCVNAKLLDKSFAGREIDQQFLNDLPENIDPCGENGEFHTFVFDAPFFEKPIPIEKGETVFKQYKTDEEESWDSGFWYCDLELKVV